MSLSARVSRLEIANGIHEPLRLSISAETEQDYEDRFLDLILSDRCAPGRRHVISSVVGGVECCEDFVLLPHEAALEHLNP
jgi:hypothetical protein